jgi:hypothetical protein
METLRDILWPVVLVGGFGAVIDFLIGKAGQERARDWLLKWWVRFDDVRWKNFGREEGIFTAHLIEKWFGLHPWSYRRISSAIILYALFLCIGFIRLAVPNYPEIWCFVCHLEHPWMPIVTDLTMYFIGFCLSISLTKFLTFEMANLCGSGKLRNILLFFVFAMVNYGLLLVWTPFLQSVKMFVGVSASVIPIIHTHGFLTFLLDGTLFKFYTPPNISKLYPDYLVGVFSNFSTADFLPLICCHFFPLYSDLFCL